MDDVQAKIEMSARIADIAIKIVWIFLWLVIAILAGLFLLALFMYAAEGSAAFSAWITTENILETLDPDIVLPDGVSPTDMFLRIAGIALGSGVVYLGLLAAMLRSMGKIFSDIRKTQLPFTKANAQRLKRAAVYMALMSIVPFLIVAAGGYLLEISTETTRLDVEFLIAAVVIYCLAHIFEYGVLLQQQSDETL